MNNYSGLSRERMGVKFVDVLFFSWGKNDKQNSQEMSGNARTVPGKSRENLAYVFFCGQNRIFPLTKCMIIARCSHDVYCFEHSKFSSFFSSRTNLCKGNFAPPEPEFGVEFGETRFGNLNLGPEFMILFFQQKRPPEKFTLKNFSS